MGIRGDKLTGTATETAESLVHRLQSLGEVTSRKMFGGYGIFGGRVMFAIVDSKGKVFLRVDDSSQGKFEAAGAQRHAKMPYFSVPDPVLSSDKDLLAWAGTALAAASKDKPK